MELSIKVNKKAKFRWIVELLSGQAEPRIIPFSNLRPREKDVLALLYYYNSEYSNIPIEYRSTILFGAETKKKIAEDLKGITLDNIYNIMMALKKQGFIVGKPEKLMYLLPNTDHITFKFTS